MQINLKQAEIVSAIKGYITSQGISLRGKKVSVSFTAGRKESGISAEVTIEDQEGYVEPIPEPVAQKRTFTSNEGEPFQEMKQDPAPPTTVRTEGSHTDITTVTPIEFLGEVEQAPTALKTQSLFG